MSDSKTLPTFSVFTPSHSPAYLDECYQSVLAQSRDDWEWNIVLNGDATSWTPVPEDPRVRVVTRPDIVGVGAAKAAACELSAGEILVELDHDDLLMPNALESLAAAFDREPDASLVYSDWAQVQEDGSADDWTYREGLGWEYRTVETPAGKRKAAVTLPPTPHNVSLIWFAPNHVRAFRRWAYQAVGGYDPARLILDDQDLMSRLYQIGPFVRVDECLYIQRMHPLNTQREPELNARIQRETVELYDLYFESNAVAWARRRGLDCVNLGAPNGAVTGFRHFAPPELPRSAWDGTIDVESGSVGVLRAVDILPLVPNTVDLFVEAARVLAPGGVFITKSPSTDGRGAFQDPRHVSYLNENSFWYFTDRAFRSYLPDVDARFQVSRLATVFPTDWHRQHQIPYVFANLIKLDGLTERNGGEILC